MWKLLLLDKTTKKTFYKNFENYYLLEQFKRKLKYSKKLVIIEEVKGY